jgi:hypothetical protein
VAKQYQTQSEFKVCSDFAILLSRRLTIARSYRKCFVRVDRPSDNAADKAGKGGWWTYNPGTDADGRPGRKGLSGKGTGEYRKGSTPSDIASRSGSRELEVAMENQQNGGSPSASMSGTPQMLGQYPAFQFDPNTMPQGL